MIASFLFCQAMTVFNNNGKWSKNFNEIAASFSRQPSRRRIKSSYLDPHIIHNSLAHMSQPWKRHFDRFSRFCVHRSRLLMLFNGADNPQIVPLSLRGSEPLSNTWFLGPTRLSSPNGISICLAVFAGLTNMTVKQTDTQTDGDRATP